jgi:error-prone DNA polymerase
MATRVYDRTAELDRLSRDEEPVAPPIVTRAWHPRNVRILPKSRDFH